MAKITVHAGDFLKGPAQFGSGRLMLRARDNATDEAIPLADLETVEIASEENVRKIGEARRKLADARLSTVVSLSAGLLSGGQNKEVTFWARFKDGRKLLATADAKTYAEIQASVF